MTVDETSAGPDVGRRLPWKVITTFIASIGLIFGLMAVALFCSLPSNTVYGQDNGFRLKVNIVASEMFPFFTKSPESPSLGAYRVDRGGQASSVLLTPQGKARNLFGLSRTQRAQGPEIALLAAQLKRKDFKSCGGPARYCVGLHKGDKPVAATDTSPVPTVCGDVYLTNEVPVPFEYRNLVSYDHRVLKIARLKVTCTH